MKTTVLYDSTKLADYDDYVEWCELNDCEPQGEYSDDYQEFVDNIVREDWEDLMDNIECSIVNDYNWLITGILGLWNGNKDIEPVLCGNLMDAIKKCIGRDAGNVAISNDRSGVYIKVWHHDGCNEFKLIPLTEKGAERFEEHGKVALRNKENVIALKEYLF